MGFGAESPVDFEDVSDFSYWNSGVPECYQNRIGFKDVLVSGGGDSGIIEVLSHVFPSFRHDEIESFIRLLSENQLQNINNALEKFENEFESDEPWQGIMAYPSTRDLINWYSTQITTTFSQEPLRGYSPPSDARIEVFREIQCVLELSGVLPFFEEDGSPLHEDHVAEELCELDLETVKRDFEERKPNIQLLYDRCKSEVLMDAITENGFLGEHVPKPNPNVRVTWLVGRNFPNKLSPLISP